MATMQAGNLVPVAFEEMVDPITNRTRIRQVDLTSYSYQVARAYMIRLERSDFQTPTVLSALASEARMTPHQFREYYESVVTRGPGARTEEEEGTVLPCIENPDDLANPLSASR